jgi:hypothetical protein
MDILFLLIEFLVALVASPEGENLLVSLEFVSGKNFLTIIALILLFVPCFLAFSEMGFSVVRIHSRIALPANPNGTASRVCSVVFVEEIFSAFGALLLFSLGLYTKNGRSVHRRPFRSFMALCNLDSYLVSQSTSVQRTCELCGQN